MGSPEGRKSEEFRNCRLINLRRFHSPALPCFLASLLFCLSISRADILFDDGNAVRSLVFETGTSLNALNADAFASLFADSPDSAFWNGGEKHIGREAITAASQSIFDAARLGEFRHSPPRVLTERTQSWATFDWEWGGSKGTALLLARVDAGVWRFAVLDLYGNGIQKPIGKYDPRRAVAVLSETVSLMERAADGMAQGDLGEILPLIHDDFHFYDATGKLSVKGDALLAAAFAPMPDGIAKEAMTLYVSHGTNRAIAFQELDGKRVSLLLLRDAARWRIHTASLSTPLEDLPVSPRGRRFIRWASLRTGDMAAW